MRLSDASNHEETIAAMEPIVLEKLDKYHKTGTLDVVKDASGIAFLVLYISDVKLCSGKMDQYCEECGIFHIDTTDLLPEEAKRKKIRIYGEHYKRIRGKVPDKM